MRKRVYIAGPISKGEITENVFRACQAAKELIRRGFAPLCPQLTAFMGYSGSPASPNDYPEACAAGIEHSVWLDVDLPWVAQSDAILRLPGESKGADIEVQFAEENGIPVFYSINDIRFGEPAQEMGFGQAMKLKAFDPREEKRGERREEFATGSVRDSREGKGRYDLLPAAALRRLAVHFENGAKKYGERNWEKGQPIARYIDSGLRHVFCWLEGRRDEDHLTAAAWNILAAVWTEEQVKAGALPKELV